MTFGFGGAGIEVLDSKFPAHCPDFGRGQCMSAVVRTSRQDTDPSAEEIRDGKGTLDATSFMSSVNPQLT